MSAPRVVYATVRIGNDEQYVTVRLRLLGATLSEIDRQIASYQAGLAVASLKLSLEHIQMDPTAPNAMVYDIGDESLATLLKERLT